MRWFLRIVVGLILLLVVITGVLYIMGTAKLNQRYSIAEPALAIPTDAASIARGRHLVVAITKCEDCHAAGLRGSVFLDVPPFRLIAPNLTRQWRNRCQLDRHGLYQGNPGWRRSRRPRASRDANSFVPISFRR